MTYRVAIFTNPNPGGQSMLLTAPDQAHLSDADLLAEAWAEAQRADLIGDAWPRVTREQFMAWTQIEAREEDPAWVWSVTDAAGAWGVSPIRVRQYLQAGRVPGAVHLGQEWAIPAGAAKPQNPHSAR